MGEKPSGVIYTMAQAGKSSAFVVHVPIKKNPSCIQDFPLPRLINGLTEGKSIVSGGCVD